MLADLQELVLGSMDTHHRSALGIDYFRMKAATTVL